MQSEERKVSVLTVMLSTYNRANILERTLNAFVEVERPSCGYELIVIDNGSKDHTAAVIQSFESRLPLIYVYEARPGKNSALNTGLEYVHGDLIVFTDDDVFPRPDWLSQYERLATEHPDFDLFGGVTLPRWESAPPTWILAWVPMGPTFTISSPTLTEGPSVPANTFGTNYAVRTKLFHAGSRFDVEIGPRGTSYAMGSETQLIQALFQNGHRIWHSTAPIVEHWVEANKLNKVWILQRAERYGRGQYRLGMEGQHPLSSSWFGIPRYLYRQVACEYVRLLKAKCMGDGRRVFLAQWQLRVTIGTVQEARVMARTNGLSGTRKAHEPVPYSNSPAESLSSRAISKHDAQY
jgi:glycosyltransferase involved in cell wall biosynthesis